MNTNPELKNCPLCNASYQERPYRIKMVTSNPHTPAVRPDHPLHGKTITSGWVECVGCRLVNTGDIIGEHGIEEMLANAWNKRAAKKTYKTIEGYIPIASCMFCQGEAEITWQGWQISCTKCGTYISRSFCKAEGPQTNELIKKWNTRLTDEAEHLEADLQKPANCDTKY